MNTRIEKIIEDLTELVIQFDDDIKKGNIEGLEKFLNIFILKLNGFSYLMSSSKYEDVKHFLNFKDEISNVYDDLFTDGNIYNMCGDTINQDGKIHGKIDALKRNGNPLNSKTFPDYRGLLITNKYVNPFHDFVSTYKGIKEEPQPDEAKKFETTLSDPERSKLCNDLITEAGSDIQKYNKRFIGKIDRPTLLYLLGGDRPEKIIKIQMAGAHQNVYDLLLSISKHKNRDGGTCLPNFVKNKFCPTILLDKTGKDIKQLNNMPKQ